MLTARYWYRIALRIYIWRLSVCLSVCLFYVVVLQLNECPWHRHCATHICIACTCYGDVAGWLAGYTGWVSVTCRYCIKTAKSILKLFRPSGSHIILVSSDPCDDTQFQGKPLQRGRYIHRVGKNGDFHAIFDGNRRLSRKRCELGRWLLWKVNRKSWVLDWMV